MKTGPLLLRALLFAFALCCLSTLVLRFHCITIYQARDIHRTMDLLQGHWIWHGPDLSGGGTAPGPFYYWLLALPLSLFGSWESLVWLELVLAAAAGVFLWELGTRRFSSMAGWLLYFLFLHSGIVRMSLTDFWNASFIFAFQALALLLLLEREKPGRLAAGAFLLGLSLQIHYTQVILFAGLLIALRRDRKALATAVAAFVLPLLPYFLWALLGASDRAVSLSTFEGVRALVTPLSRLSIQSATNQFRNFLHNATVFDTHFPLVLGIWGGALVALARSRKRLPLPKDPFVWTTFGVAVVPLLLIAYESAFLRYIVPLALLVYIITARLGAELVNRFPRVFLAGTVLAGLGWLWLSANGSLWIGDIFLIWRWQSIAMVSFALAIAICYLRGTQGTIVSVLLAITILGTASAHKLPLTHSYPEFNWDLQARARLATALAGATGWDYNRLRERTYLLGIQPEEDLSVLYENAFRARPPGQTSPAREADGVLVIGENWGGLGNFKTHAPAELAQAWTSGELECLKTESAGGFQICYYRFKSGAARTWNNLGHPYRRQPQAQAPANAALLEVDPCKTREPACTLYFLVSVPKPGTVDVQAFGDPIGGPDSAVNPAWNASIKDASLEIQCGRTWSQQRLVSLLGAPARGAPSDPFFLAPYRNQFHAGCARPETIAISATRGSSSFNGVPANGDPVGSLAPFRVEWKLVSQVQ